MRHQQRIGCIDHHEVVQPDGTDHAGFAVKVGVGDVVRHRIALDAVALGIGRNQLGDRIPGADVVPVEAGRHDGHALGFFHHRIVHRDVGQSREGRQQLIVDRLDETARTLAASTQAQASRTIEQVSALMQTAAEAPRVAAEVIGELREALSASIARDNAALDERNRIMETLRGLLDAINHASIEQRQAIDALVASSASALQRAAAGFEQRMDAEATRLADTGQGADRLRFQRFGSGSLSTAGRAFELGRHVAMVPGPVTSAASAGCHEWLRTKPVSLVTDGRDVLDLMGQLGVDAMDPRRLRSTVLDLITDDDEALYSAVPVRDGADVTALQRASGLSAQDTTKGLARLQALGVVERRAGRWRKAALT